MAAYIIRRFLIGIFVLILVTMIVFLLMRLLPGDPLMAYMSGSDISKMTPEGLDYLRHQYGLDQPLPVQYGMWMKDVLHGDLGKSILLKESITKLIGERMPITFHLGILSFIISVFLGILAGVICAIRRGTWIDNVVTLLANAGMTVPVFWLGILLIYFFSLKLDWLPIAGYTSPFDDFWLSTRQIILPVFCLAVGGIAGLCRLTRSCMLEVMKQDYVRTAWSKGLTERVIVVRHQIKNALIPVVTVLGMSLGQILAGSILVETVFNIPGMGRLMTNGVFEQDYQIVQAGVLIFGAIVIFSNLLVDIAYVWVDPRVKYS
jgi:peptide/nickel transport system permease protein